MLGRHAQIREGGVRVDDYLTQADADLLKRIRTRDDLALAAMYRRYGERVYALAYRILGDSGRAEEIRQDVFFRLWEQSERYQASKGQVISWLLTITRHFALDHHKRRLPRNMVWVSITSDLKIFRDLDAEQSIRQALQSLPASQRKVLELAYFQGLTHVEICQRLGEPVGTVKTRIRLGLQKLRSSLCGCPWRSVV